LLVVEDGGSSSSIAGSSASSDADQDELSSTDLDEESVFEGKYPQNVRTFAQSIFL
jgi:hypothetical protein